MRIRQSGVSRNPFSDIFTAGLMAGVLLAAPVSAQDDVQQMPTVVVSANRVPLPIEQVGSAVTVVIAEEIERRQVRLVSDVLRDVPGLAVSRTGGVGTRTQVRIRGAEGNQTLVIIDGIEVNDPSGGSEFDFADLLAADIERIEVLRGPQSALWGSDAIGGVINIVTKGGLGDGVQATGQGEYGSFDTRQGGGSLRAGLEDKISIAFGATHYHTDGISSASKDRGNDETDAYDNLTAYGKLTVRPLDFLQFDVVGRHVDASTETDAFIGGVGAVDADSATDSEQSYARAQAKVTLFDGLWEHIGSVSYSSDLNDNFSSDVLVSEFDGEKWKLDYQTNLLFETPEIADAEHGLTFAIEQEDESVNAESAFVSVDRDLATTSFVGEYRLGLLDRVFLSGAIRHDDNDELFDDQTTHRVTGAYLHHETGTRLHGSYGTGVKNPTIFELFGFSANFVGNPDLEPESSTGFDIGVEQSFFDGRAVIDATFFYNEIEDLILGAGNTAINLDGTTEARGVEVTGRATIIDGLDVIGSYTFTHTEDPSGDDLVRRARHIASLNVNYTFDLFGRPGNLNLGVDYNGEQEDFAFDAAFNRSIVTLDDYALLTLAGAYQVYDGVEVFGRVENLLDQDYEEVFTFGTPGISAFGGVRVKFRPYR